MNKYELSDSELVSLYINGNEEAFKQLIEKHKSKCFTTIYLIVKDKFIAEDLFQETLIKVVNTLKSGRYDEKGKFLPWMLRIAHNLAIDRYRKEKRFPTIVMEDGNPVFNTLAFAEAPQESAQIKKELHSKLRSMIQELPEKQKQVLIMRQFMGMSFKEIAEHTDVSVNTALGRMRYALINLRKKMKQYNIAYDENFYPG